MGTIKGISKKADLQEALNDALKQTEENPIKDSRVAYKITEILGVSGGITGENQVTVVIETQPF